MSCGTSGRTRVNTAASGHICDRDELRADERGLDSVHDVCAVVEGVEANRVQVELGAVLRVRREDAGVPVAVADQGRDPHQLDDELVPGQRRGSGRRALHRCLEPSARDAVERPRMELAQRLGELADVAGGSGRLRTGRRSDERGHDRQENEQPHASSSSRSTQSVHWRRCSACSSPSRSMNQ